MARQAFHQFLFLLTFSVPAILVIRGWIALHRRRFMVSRELLWLISVVYTTAVVAITLAPLRATSQKMDLYNVNLVPVIKSAKMVTAAIAAHNAHFISYLVENMLGNVLLFVPLGLLAPCLARRFRRFPRVALLGLLCSTVIEILQFMWTRFGHNYRYTDVDDVLLNTLGACAGYFLFYLLAGKREPPRAAARL